MKTLTIKIFVFLFLAIFSYEAIAQKKGTTKIATERKQATEVKESALRTAGSSGTNATEGHVCGYCGKFVRDIYPSTGHNPCPFKPPFKLVEKEISIKNKLSTGNKIVQNDGALNSIIKSLVSEKSNLIYTKVVQNQDNEYRLLSMFENASEKKEELVSIPLIEEKKQLKLTATATIFTSVDNATATETQKTIDTKGQIIYVGAVNTQAVVGGGGEKLKCSYCGNSFSNPNMLLKHACRHNTPKKNGNH